MSTDCASCVVSNRWAVLAIGILLFAMGAVVAIIVWCIALDQTLQIVVTVISGVSAILAIVLVALPIRCKPCKCGQEPV
jgi:hypothetical protein